MFRKSTKSNVEGKVSSRRWTPRLSFRFAHPAMPTTPRCSGPFKKDPESPSPGVWGPRPARTRAPPQTDPCQPRQRPRGAEGDRVRAPRPRRGPRPRPEAEPGARLSVSRPRPAPAKPRPVPAPRGPAPAPPREVPGRRAQRVTGRGAGGGAEAEAPAEGTAAGCPDPPLLRRVLPSSSRARSRGSVSCDFCL